MTKAPDISQDVPSPIDLRDAADVTHDAWADALTPPFDAAVAMQAVHEVRHKRHVPRLYARIRALLRPGGMRVVRDHAPPDDSARLTALHATEHAQHAALTDAGFAEITTHTVLHGRYLCSGRCPGLRHCRHRRHPRSGP